MQSDATTDRPSGTRHRAKKVVIIGAGPGGLAASLLLANAGLEVHIVERLSHVGGRTSAHGAQGFRSALGPTMFINPEILAQQGKVRHVGCSNFAAWQVALGLGISNQHGLRRWDTVQPRYNLLQRDIEAELLPLCRDQEIGVIAYNPLAGGFLSGKYRREEAAPPNTRFTLEKTGQLYRDRYWHDAQFEVVERLQAFFDARGKRLATAAVAWTLARPGITCAIVGASRAEQLDATLAATTSPLDDERAIMDEAWSRLPRPAA